MAVHHTSYSDNQLIGLIRSGDEAAFSELYNRYSLQLAEYAAARLSSLEEAKDILQDLFVHMWQQRESLEVHTNVAAYLFTAIRYRVISHIRRRQHMQRYREMVEALYHSADANDQVITEVSDLRKAVEASIDELEPRTREIYKLSRQQQLSISEIASHFNISERTVKNQITTALKHLRHSWDKLAIFILTLIS